MSNEIRFRGENEEQYSRNLSSNMLFYFGLEIYIHS